MKTKNTVTSKMFTLATLVLMLSSSMAMADDSARADHEKMRAAFKECAESLGIAAPVQGQRPQALDEATRASLDACLKEKGFTPPEHRGPRGGGDGDRRGPPPGDDGGGPQNQ
jgi:hypothetical protein